LMRGLPHRSATFSASGLPGSGLGGAVRRPLSRRTAVVFRLGFGSPHYRGHVRAIRRRAGRPPLRDGRRRGTPRRRRCRTGLSRGIGGADSAQRKHGRQGGGQCVAKFSICHGRHQLKLWGGKTRGPPGGAVSRSLGRSGPERAWVFGVPSRCSTTVTTCQMRYRRPFSPHFTQNPKNRKNQNTRCNPQSLTPRGIGVSPDRGAEVRPVFLHLLSNEGWAESPGRVWSGFPSICVRRTRNVQTASEEPRAGRSPPSMQRRPPAGPKPLFTSRHPPR
jgi:hypothetical protein